jgi:polar amino acid transport system substrate-binding protein
MHLGRLGQVGELVEVMPLAQQLLRGSMADCRQVVRVVCMRRVMALAGICVASLLASGSGLAQTGKLSLVTGALPPLSAAPGHPGFLNELARALFKRVGVEVEVSTLPVERVMINVNSGLDDGDLFRTAGAEQDFPNLLRVPEKVLDFEFMAYTNRPEIRVATWADLAPYVVAYTTGYRIYDRSVKGVKEITKTASIQELFPLLDKGRADVVLIDRWQAQWIIRRDGYLARPIEPPLARVEMFIYLNKKHAALVPKVAQALAEMKTDGSYQKLYDAYLKPLNRQ